MRSRIQRYSNNLVIYDFLTQYSIKNYTNTPTFSCLTIHIKNTQINDLKQTCFNLIAIQLLGNNFMRCGVKKDISSFILKSTGINIYFILDNIALIGYKKKVFFCKTHSRVYSRDFLSIIEYYLLDSQLIKLAEQVSNKRLKIVFSYSIKNNADSNIIVYFLRSLGLPH